VEFRDGRIVAYAKQQRNPNMRHIDYGLEVFGDRLSPISRSLHAI
jgi:hypothetical protein